MIESHASGCRFNVVSSTLAKRGTRLFCLWIQWAQGLTIPGGPPPELGSPRGGGEHLLLTHSLHTAWPHSQSSSHGPPHSSWHLAPPHTFISSSSSSHDMQLCDIHSVLSVHGSPHDLQLMPPHTFIPPLDTQLPDVHCQLKLHISLHPKWHSPLGPLTHSPLHSPE